MLVLKSVCGQQDNAAAQDHTHRRDPPAHKTLQLGSYFLTQMGRWRYTHIGHLNCI
jgi:hypothetical protein